MCMYIVILYLHTCPPSNDLMANLKVILSPYLIGLLIHESST